MGILTSSQLTFQDLKDTYNIRINPEYIVLDCNSSGAVKSETTKTIEFGTYNDNVRIKTKECTVNPSLTGVTTTSPVQATTSLDGSFNITIASGSTLGGVSSALIKLSIVTEDNFLFEKYITLIKSVTGASGNGVNSITREFYLSTSKSSLSGGSWTTNPPAWENGKFLWFRDKIIYSDSPNSPVYTISYCDSSWLAVNDITVGGKNFLVQSKDMTDWTRDWNSGGSIDYQPWGKTSDGFRVFDAKTGSPVKSRWFNSRPAINYANTGLRGKEVIVSWDARSDEADIINATTDEGMICEIDLCTSDSTSRAKYKLKYLYAKNYPLSNDWQRYSCTFKLDDDSWSINTTSYPNYAINGETRIFVRIYAFSPHAMQIKCVKLAEGNVLTYWTPAPEDLLSLSIYSPDGDTFTDDITSITMKAYALDGVTAIDSSDISYKWYKYNSGSWDDKVKPPERDSSTSSNVNNAYTECTDSELTINRNDVINTLTYKCVMNYHGIHEAYYTVDDTTDIYMSEIRTVNGTVLNANKQYLIAYAYITKNGEEVDPVIGSIWTDTNNDPEDAGAYYRVRNEVLSTDIENEYDSDDDGIEEAHSVLLNDIILQYYDGSGGWTDYTSGELIYKYDWSSSEENEYFNFDKKVILLNSNHIVGSTLVSCSISKEVLSTDIENESEDIIYESISNCQLSFTDLNDPIVSDLTPTNPKVGLLWLDTSCNPFKIKVYNNLHVWEAVLAYNGGNAKIFTSKPNKDDILDDGKIYHVGDMWVLESDTDHPNYSKRTILVCTEDSSTYDNSHWVDANNISELRNSVTSLLKYEEVMLVFSDGLYLFGRQTGEDASNESLFYSQLGSKELAFFLRSKGSVPEDEDEWKTQDHGQKIIWISGELMHANKAEIESSVTITNKNNNNIMPYIKIGDLLIQQEQNGSYSITKT